MVPSLFKGRLGWVFDRRKAATLRSASSVRNFAPTRGEGSSIYLSSEANEKNFSPFTTHISQMNPPLTPPLKSEGKKAAFTLAEVLITLGIIGVVAAITMPTLIAKHQKQIVETRLKAFYSTFNQAIRMSEIDNGPKEQWWPLSCNGGEYSEECLTFFFNTYLKNYIKYVDAYYQQADSIFSQDSFRIKMPDGTLICIGYGGHDFFVFINGIPKKKIYGKNLFPFAFYPQLSPTSIRGQHWSGKGIEPYLCQGWDGTYEDLFPNNMCSGQNATKIIQLNGWKIPDNYPVKF